MRAAPVFFYVREDLQGTVVTDFSFPGYVHFNYSPWATVREGDDDFPYIAPRDARRYEPGNVNAVAYAGQYEALKRILGMGVDKIYAYTKPMCDRLKKELPGLGYKLITPLDAAS